jgi:hypothetical protein
MLDGTLYIVSAGQDVLPPREHDALPPRDLMISKGIRIEPGAEAETARLPGDTEMKVISPKQAADLFEGRADWIEGVTVGSYLPWFAEHWLTRRAVARER